jgi:Cd2+/Zn2+-exporting ATPase
VLFRSVGVSLIVVANALRLLRAKGRDPAAPSGGESIGEHMPKGALAHGH